MLENSICGFQILFFLSSSFANKDEKDKRRVKSKKTCTTLIPSLSFPPLFLPLSFFISLFLSPSPPLSDTLLFSPLVSLSLSHFSPSCPLSSFPLSLFSLFPDLCGNFSGSINKNEAPKCLGGYKPRVYAITECPTKKLPVYFSLY